MVGEEISYENVGQRTVLLHFWTVLFIEFLLNLRQQELYQDQSLTGFKSKKFNFAANWSEELWVRIKKEGLREVCAVYQL